MERRTRTICRWALVAGSLSACTKSADEPAAPSINDYRTYDLVTVEAKADPAGGEVLLCKNTPVDRRTAFLQLLGPSGDLGTRIDLDALPTTIENVGFTRDELLFTDMLALSDGFFVVGIGRQIQQNDRLHLIVHRLDRSGRPIGTAFRRFLVEGGSVNVNIDGSTQDLDGLPRSRALCDRTNNGDLMVAARWETQDSAGIRLFRFPFGGSNGIVAQLDIPLNAADDRLNALACDPANGTTVLVHDASLPGTDHMTMVREFATGAPEWGLAGDMALEFNGGNRNAEPQQLFCENGTFLLLGNWPLGTNDAKPFVTRFSTVSEVNANIRVLQGLGPEGSAVTAYCALPWQGGYSLLTNAHQASALQPFFDGDITSDLGVAELGGADLAVGGTRSLIPGQGLRAIGVFSSGGGRVIIGSQHPFLNAGYVHTFYLAVD